MSERRRRLLFEGINDKSWQSNVAVGKRRLYVNYSYIIARSKVELAVVHFFFFKLINRVFWEIGKILIIQDTQLIQRDILITQLFNLGVHSFKVILIDSYCFSYPLNLFTTLLTSGCQKSLNFKISPSGSAENVMDVG